MCATIVPDDSHIFARKSINRIGATRGRGARPQSTVPLQQRARNARANYHSQKQSDQSLCHVITIWTLRRHLDIATNATWSVPTPK